MILGVDQFIEQIRDDAVQLPKNAALTSQIVVAERALEMFYEESEGVFKTGALRESWQAVPAGSTPAPTRRSDPASGVEQMMSGIDAFEPFDIVNPVPYADVWDRGIFWGEGGTGRDTERVLASGYHRNAPAGFVDVVVERLKAEIN